MLASGPLPRVALAVKAALDGRSPNAILVFDDVSAIDVKFDLRGIGAENIERPGLRTLAPPSRQPMSSRHIG